MRFNTYHVPNIVPTHEKNQTNERILGQSLSRGSSPGGTTESRQRVMAIQKFVINILRHRWTHGPPSYLTSTILVRTALKCHKSPNFSRSEKFFSSEFAS